MEFCAQQSDLLKELELAQGAVEKKSSIPILAHVLLEAADSNLRISATDLELGARSHCPAKVKTPGVGTVPGRRVLEIVRSLPDSEVRFKLLENHWVQVTCERSTFKLVGLAKDNFPALPPVPKAQADVPASLLAGLVQKTSFAVSDQENRVILNAALLSVKTGSVRMVATDGHRLILAEHEHATDGLATELSLLIPKRALGELRRVLGEAPEEASVQITSDEKHIFFTIGDRLLISRMLTGMYPNYEAVLPRENNKVLELDTDQVRTAVRRVALLASEHSNAVRVLLEKDRLEIASSGGEYGEATEILDGRNEHEPVKIGFNYRYLLDFFEVLKRGERIRMALKDDQSAVEFRPVDEEPGSQYRYVLMPLRI
jgi:DNA polymerase III subunit beta